MILEHDGKCYSQTGAILRYLGAVFGYYPADALQAWKADSIVDSSVDIYNTYAKAFFEPNEEKKNTLFDDLINKVYPAWLEAMNNRLIKNGSKEHIVGTSWTTADFAIAGFLSAHAWNEANNLHDRVQEQINKFEHVKVYAENLKKGLGGYLEKRPKPRPF